jgi:chromosomal replication initiator protein
MLIARAKAQDEIGRPEITFDTVCRYVCRTYGVPWIDLTSSRRTADIVRQRQVIMYLARVHTTRSFPEIGRKLGGRDHTTCLHGYRKIKKLVDNGEIEVPSYIDILTFQIIREQESAGK